MGFFQRLANLWSGFLSLWISDVEGRNPEAVYEAAIEERVRKHKELKKAVSGIVYLRNKLASELETKERELKEVMTQLPIAVQEGEDEVALVLIEKKDQLAGAIEHLLLLALELLDLGLELNQSSLGLFGLIRDLSLIHI